MKGLAAILLFVAAASAIAGDDLLPPGGRGVRQQQDRVAPGFTITPVDPIRRPPGVVQSAPLMQMRPAVPDDRQRERHEHRRRPAPVYIGGGPVLLLGPGYLPPAPVYIQPPAYSMEQDAPLGTPVPMAPMPPAAPAAPIAFWYFCNNPKGFYPQVADCPGGWEAVPASPPAE